MTGDPYYYEIKNFDFQNSGDYNVEVIINSTSEEHKIVYLNSTIKVFNSPEPAPTPGGGGDSALTQVAQTGDNPLYGLLAITLASLASIACVYIYKRR